MAKSPAERQAAYRERKRMGLVNGQGSGPIVNAQALFAMASVLTKRYELMTRMGKSFGTKRDIYEALGYRKTLVYSDYVSRYERGDIARKIINLPAAATWRKKPTVRDGEANEQTAFDKAWETVLKKRKVFHYLTRLDRIVGIGQYGVLLLGLNDGKRLDEEVQRATELLYLQPYSENNAEIKDYEKDTANERYGLPNMYQLTLTSADKTGTKTRLVHHSRVIHVAEGTTENDVHGTPRLKAVFNRLQDLELVAGGSAEMFWRGAFPGYAFKEQKDYELDTQAMSALEDELEKYMHDLQRYLRLRGVDIENLQMQVADPRGHAEILIELIAAASGIPKRILLGSERGELASSQDEREWAATIDSRRKDFAEPMILRPFIDRLISFGILPSPTKGDYEVEWPQILVPSEKEEAEVGKIKAEAINKYVMAPGADMILPPEIFYEVVLGLTQDQIRRVSEILEETTQEGEE